MMADKIVNEFQVRGAPGMHFRAPAILYLSVHIKYRLCAWDLYVGLHMPVLFIYLPCQTRSY
jgi:hypothetical protein